MWTEEQECDLHHFYTYYTFIVNINISLFFTKLCHKIDNKLWETESRKENKERFHKNYRKGNLHKKQNFEVFSTYDLVWLIIIQGFQLNGILVLAGGREVRKGSQVLLFVKDSQNMKAV